MKATLTFDDPRWDMPATEQRLRSGIFKSRKELKEAIREEHRRGGDLPAIYLVTSSQGSGFSAKHKVSRRGNPPSPDTLTLLNNIADRDLGTLSGEVYVKDAVAPGGSNPAVYGPILDNPSKLNRPFFATTAEKYRPTFEKNMENALNNVS